jgi:Cd(II)/Pb(II)-responsive transcriptional regulator
MKIGELAQRSGCKVETVRFYEREGLLEAPERDDNGYRNYTTTHLVELNFIRHCRLLGMGLPDVRILHGLQSQPALACDEINHLIDRKIEHVHQQIEALHLLEQQLQTLRDTCNSVTRVGECKILHNLELAAEGKDCSCHSHSEAD